MKSRHAQFARSSALGRLRSFAKMRWVPSMPLLRGDEAWRPGAGEEPRPCERVFDGLRGSRYSGDRLRSCPPVPASRPTPPPLPHCASHPTLSADGSSRPPQKPAGARGRAGRACRGTKLRRRGRPQASAGGDEHSSAPRRPGPRPNIPQSRHSRTSSMGREQTLAGFASCAQGLAKEGGSR